MDQYKQFLSTQVINEGHIVNYRLLSRSLKVHTDLAKQMLYDFHHKQNAKKTGTVYATYLVRGIKKQGGLQNGDVTSSGKDANGARESVTDAEGDSFMVSSPTQSYLPDLSQKTIADDDDVEIIHTQTSTLCKEENLDAIRSQYSEITSIFVYSLGPSPLDDLYVLSECNRQVIANFSGEDPLKAWKQFGIIQNPYTKRRTGRPLMPTVITPVAPAAAKSAKPIIADSKTAKAEPEPESRSQESKPSLTDSKRTPANQAKTAGKVVRRESSDLFKAFAKGKQAKAKSQASQGSQSSVADSPAASQAEDVDMDDAPAKTANKKSRLQETAESSEEDDALIAIPKNSEKGDAARKAREARQAKLKALMDDDDEDDVTPNGTATTKENTQPSDEEPEDAMEIDEGALDADSQKEPEPQETMTISGGRRRGRRKVMKKKTTQDEEGYLVTTEEPAWESFSEDEPEPKKLKPSTSTFGTGSKPAKKVATKGQGNIMNFFGKK